VSNAEIFSAAAEKMRKNRERPRVEQPDPNTYTADDLSAYEQIPDWRKGENAGAFFGVLLQSPRFALNRAGLSTLMRTAAEYETTTFSHADRELIDHVLAKEMKSNDIFGIHVGDAVAAGVRIEAIEAIREGDDTRLTDDERLLATYIREFAHGTVTDETFAAMEQRMGSRGVVEYTYIAAVLMMSMRMMQAFGCPEPIDEDVDTLIATYRAGADLPDWRERIR
jgi:alkylhydroperoxidase family enzyme